MAEKAQIFLAEQRGTSGSNTFRRVHQFEAEAFRAEGREPFGPLYLLDDVTLTAGESLPVVVACPTDLLLLPLVGGLEYAFGTSGGFLVTGQATITGLTTGQLYTISNPYESEAIRFLLIGLARPGGVASSTGRIVGFSPAVKNRLQSVFADEGRLRWLIGQYDGRQEGTYCVQEGRRLFVLVLQGVFEVANRLLHENDGLALRYEADKDVEFEALSNDALLLLLDFQP